MKTLAPPIPFAGHELRETRHVCAFFNSEDEEYRVLLPFIKDGFACGDKAVHVVSRERRRDHLQRLQAAGIDPAAAERSGQLELRTNTEAYLRDGRFDQDDAALIVLVEKYDTQSKICGDMLGIAHEKTFQQGRGNIASSIFVGQIRLGPGVVQ